MTDFLAYIAKCKQESKQLVLIVNVENETYTLPQDKFVALKDVVSVITRVTDNDEDCNVYITFNTKISIVGVMDNTKIDDKSITDYLRMIKYLLSINGTKNSSDVNDILSDIIEGGEFNFCISETITRKLIQYIEDHDAGSQIWRDLSAKKDYSYNLWERRYWPNIGVSEKNHLWKKINSKVAKHDYPLEITGESDEATEYRLELQVANNKFNNNYASYEIPKHPYRDLNPAINVMNLFLEINRKDLCTRMFAYIVINPNNAHIVKMDSFWNICGMLFKRENVEEENMLMYLLHFPLYILSHEESIVFTRVSVPSRIVLTADEASKFIQFRGVHIQRNPYVQVMTGAEKLELITPYYNRDTTRTIVDQKQFNTYFEWATGGVFKGINLIALKSVVSGSVIRACRCRIDSHWKDYRNVNEKYYVHPLELRRRALGITWAEFFTSEEFKLINLPEAKDYDSMEDIEQHNKAIRDSIATGISKGKYVDEKKKKDEKKTSSKSKRKEELSDDDILTDSESDGDGDIKVKGKKHVTAEKVLELAKVSKSAIKSTKKELAKPRKKIIPPTPITVETDEEVSDDEGAPGPGTEFRLCNGTLVPITPTPPPTPIVPIVTTTMNVGNADNVANELPNIKLPVESNIVNETNTVNMTDETNKQYSDNDVLSYKEMTDITLTNEDIERANFLAMMARYYPGYESLTNSEFKLICTPPDRLGKYVKPKYNPMADIDLSIHTDSFAEFEAIAEEIYKSICTNAKGPVWMQRIPTATATKFRIYGPGMLRDVDVFMVKKRTPAMLTKAYHFDCVHSWYDNEVTYSFVGCVLSDLTGLNRTYKWFSCAKDPGDIVMKYVERSCTIPLNINERKVLEEFIKLSELWNGVFTRFPNMAIWGSVYANHPIFHADAFKSGIKIKCRQTGIIDKVSEFGHYHRSVNWETTYNKNLARYNADGTHIKQPDLTAVIAFIKHMY